VDLAAAGTPLPAFITAPDWVLSLLFSDNGGRALQRAIRARFPNGDPETVQWPEGWAAGGTWTAPTPDENTTVIQVPFPRNYPGMFQDYFLGVGGPCKVYNESDNNEGFGPVQSVGYWCQPHGRTGGALYFSRQPSALTLGAADLPNAPYALPAATSNGATLSFWRPSHWYNSLAKLASATTAPGSGETTLAWTFGAFHGGEGADAGEDWVVEHVLEELDAPREFFFDAGAQRLHFFHNASAGVPPPPDWSFEVPLLRCLLRVTGTPEAPVAGVTLSGITFTSAAAAVLANRGIPTGGDWSVARVGALTVEGAAGLTLRGLNFTRLDGNAVSINGWNRDINIVGCEFAWLGESAVASWGRADGADARRGTQPLRTNMSGCVCREIGLIEKQNSCYFGALSGSATIADNIFYNMPRAAVCFEDDALGGSIVTRNLVFNTCRESQDHGPFNSWGRVPFSVNFPNGSDSGGLKPLADEISHNLLVAGGGANSGAADHDDGSSFYEDHHNVMIYGGHKSNFFGHSKRSTANLMAFPLVYQPLCLRIYAGLPLASPGGLYAEGYANNTCILASPTDLYMSLGKPCEPGEPDLSLRIRLGGNKVYAPAGGGGVSCGNTTLPFEAWAATGADPGTVLVEGVPSSDQIVAWAADLLGVPLLSAARAATSFPCATAADCALNGDCVNATCLCDAAWTTSAGAAFGCATLALLPAARGAGLHSLDSGANTSSWGGSVLRDEATGQWHMWASEITAHCGINAWTYNSRIVHATSATPLGRFERDAEFAGVFSHEPTAVRDPTSGEWAVFYTSAIPSGRAACNCSDGSTTAACEASNAHNAAPARCARSCDLSDPNNQPYARLSTLIQQARPKYGPQGPTFVSWAAAPAGPWSPPLRLFSEGAREADTNLAPLIFANGSLLGIWRTHPGAAPGSIPHLVRAAHWKNASSYVWDATPILPLQLPEDVGLEDPHLWQSTRGFHILFHAFRLNASTAAGDYGGHAFSRDGWAWTWSGIAYNNTGAYADGSRFDFRGRQRPHLVFGDGAAPLGLTNGVIYADATTAGTDACMTFVQPVRTA
jgi:hypothetical protein